MTKRETTTEMNVQEKANQQDEAKKIWDQLEAEDSGRAQPESFSSEDPPEPQPAQANPADPAPAAQADASQGSDEVAAPSEQALMDKISGLESMLGQVTQRLRNAEGHIGGLNSQLKQQVQTAQQVTARGGEAPSAGEIRAAQANPEKMNALKRDYPEFADAMESALNERLSAMEQRLATQQQPAQQPGVSAEEIASLRSEMAVEIRHPGWKDRVQTPEFVGWLQRQPREVQMLAASDSPQDAVRLLDLHGEATSAATSQRTQRLASAAAIPSGRSGSNIRAKAVEDMTPQEYWAYLDQLDKQKA
jgi:hypothetical protein